MSGSAGVVLAGGRSSRMGSPKAALEWHGSTLLRRTVGILARATGGPVVVVRAPGQELPPLPPDVEIISDPREGKGPVQGLAAGLGALVDRADVAFVSSTDMPFLHPAFVRRVLRAVHEGADVGLPVARGYPQPLAAAYRTKLAATAERLVLQERLRPAFLFETCTVARLDEAALKDDPVLAALDPGLDSVVNINEPDDYRTARSQPGPEITVQRFGVLANGPGPNGAGPRNGPRGHRGRSRGGRRRRFRRARDSGAERRPDHPRRPDAAGGGGHGLLPVRRRGRLSAMTAGGYFGRALVVDVGTGTSDVLPLPDELLRAYIGGAGLGAWLMHHLGPPGADPLAPEAPLAYVFSPLVGTPLTTSAKFAVVAKSPLTGLLTDALASSHFAIAGKLTGYDAIVVRGACATPSALLIDKDGARIEDAADLSGLTAAQAGTRLRQQLGERLGRGWRVAAIGPAGERGVRYATISHDGRHAGRGGLGAVLGAKRLKAIAVRAAAKVAPADPDAVLAAARDLRARSFGPATAKYRELGTLANLLAFNAISTLPTQNFQAATFDGAPRLAAEDLAAMRQVARHSCASCTIGCEHIYKARDGRKTRVEYENVFALGPMCGVSDPDAVLAASARCDDLGLDTISAGGTIAWAMECAERGLIDAPWLRFGDGDALLKALEQIGERDGLGDLLAEGSRRAAQRVGGGSSAFAPHVKGMEMPGYEPRTLHAMALGLAVNARGADHNRSGAYEADLSGDLDRLDGGDAHVAAAVETEDRAAVMDSLILCKFLRGVFTDPFTEWASLLSAVTGWDVDGAELRRTARRIVLAKRVYNSREGWRPADDWLPERLLTEPLRLASGREARLSPARLRAMIDGYYATRGLDEQGLPDEAQLTDLRLS